MHVYVQSTGEWFQDEELLGCGYSGFAASKNVPSDQDKHNLGPIPQGLYQIQAPEDTQDHGPYALPLAPHLNNRMFGRNAFLIHGDSIEDPGTASHGCIILGRPIRQRIWESGDHDLQVIASI